MSGMKRGEVDKRGDGDEYQLQAAERVVVDQWVRLWRLDQFMKLGFELADAEQLAARADVDLNDVRTWVGQGAKHATVLRIVAPEVEEPECPVLCPS